MPKTSEETLQLLDRLVGAWTTEGTHPAVPGTIVRGTATIEWLEGRRFLIQRARTDQASFPDSISIIGFTDRDRVDAGGEVPADGELTMHYFDSRGVFRVYSASVDDATWQLSRPAAGFSQRFTGTFGDGGDTIAGTWQVCEDGVHWRDDLAITYRRSR